MSAPTAKPTLGLLRARCNAKLVKILEINKQKRETAFEKRGKIIELKITNES